MSIVAGDLRCHDCGFQEDHAVEYDGAILCPQCLALRQAAEPVAPGGMILRPYQEDAVQGVFSQLQDHKSALVVLPTGCGKTIVFAEVSRRWQQGRVLVLAHREELIFQASHKITKVTGEECDIEMGEYYADRRSLLDQCRVVISTVQTMSRTRRHSRFHPEEFGLVIIDEAHHSTSKTYKAVTEYFQHAKILGVTATPDRADEAALGQVFESVAAEYDLPTAIQDGWLVPIEQQFVFVEGLDFSNIKTTAGDLNQGELAEVLETESNLHEIVYPTLDIAKEKKTLMFTASVAQAERVCEIANRYKPDCARWICGDLIKTPKEARRDTLKSFANGDFQMLINCGVLLEGYDEPGIEVVAVARPTKSRSLYSQVIGRGTRTLPGVIDGLATAEERKAAIAASAKPSVLVLDFVGNSGRHKLIHTGDILGGNYDDEIVAEATKAVQAASKAGERKDMLTALHDAQEAKHEAERKLRERLVAKAQYQTKLINPFAVWDLMPQREPGWHHGRKPTDGQAAALEKMGLKAKEINAVSFCQASQLIDESQKRRAANLCSFRQAKVLARFGYETKELGFKEAGALIETLAKNGWKR